MRRAPVSPGEHDANAGAYIGAEGSDSDASHSRFSATDSRFARLEAMFQALMAKLFNPDARIEAQGKSEDDPMPSSTGPPAAQGVIGNN